MHRITNRHFLCCIVHHGVVLLHVCIMESYSTSWNHIPLHEEGSINNMEINIFSHLGNAVGQCLTIEYCTNRCFWNLQELYVLKGELSF